MRIPYWRAQIKPGVYWGSIVSGIASILFSNPLVVSVRNDLIGDQQNIQLCGHRGGVLQQRPDLIALDYTQKAAHKFSRAEHEQLLPTINTDGVVGGTPVRDDRYFNSNWFGAIGVNLSVPLFNGFLYTAQASEASQRAKAAQENLRDLRDNIVRNVNDAWLETNTSYEKIGVTEKLLTAANLGLDLAQARYKLGLSSIVELSQSQLQQTQAAIENINARYAYELSLAALNYQIGNMP